MHSNKELLKQLAGNGKEAQQAKEQLINNVDFAALKKLGIIETDISLLPFSFFVSGTGENERYDSSLKGNKVSLTGAQFEQLKKIYEAANINVLVPIRFV